MTIFWISIGGGLKTVPGCPGSVGYFLRCASKKMGRRSNFVAEMVFNAYHFHATHLESIISVDFDEAAIEHARKNFKNPKISYQACDIRVSIPSGKFDNIIWDAAIEHFSPTEISKILSSIKERLKDDGIFSGYTITKRPDGKKSHHEHEYEFSSKEDLMDFLSPHFQRVRIFETDYPDRHNLYFYASDGAPLPFDADWNAGISIMKNEKL